MDHLFDLIAESGRRAGRREATARAMRHTVQAAARTCAERNGLPDHAAPVLSELASWLLQKLNERLEEAAGFGALGFGNTPEDCLATRDHHARAVLDYAAYIHRFVAEHTRAHARADEASRERGEEQGWSKGRTDGFAYGLLSPFGASRDHCPAGLDEEAKADWFQGFAEGEAEAEEA